LRSSPGIEYRKNAINIHSIQETETSLIEAKNWQVNDRGNIELFAENDPQNPQRKAIECPIQ
jgi:hypothetical protein